MLWLVLQNALLATLCSAAQPHFSEGDDFPNLAPTHQCLLQRLSLESFRSLPRQ